MVSINILTLMCGRCVVVWQWHFDDLEWQKSLKTLSNLGSMPHSASLSGSYCTVKKIRMLFLRSLRVFL